MDWFGFTILIIIILIGYSVLKPKSKRTYRQNWSKYGYSKDRDNKRYEEWREKIRNKYPNCVCCGLDYSLEAHHIIPFSRNRWKRYRVSNGVMLCASCHTRLHDEYTLDECNKKTLNAYIKKYKRYAAR